MGVDAGIFGALLQPPKSVEDYQAEAQNKQGNALALLLKQQQVQQGTYAMQDRERGLQRQNALTSLMQTPGFDPGKPEYQSQLIQTDPVMGGKILDDYAKRQKEFQDVESSKATAGKTQSETVDGALKRFRGALDYIDTPQGAARWMQAQYSDPVTGPYMQNTFGPIERSLQNIPTDPQGFQNWRGIASQGMEKHIEQVRAQQIADETGRHNKATEYGTIRGQNMVDARSRDANNLTRTANATVYDPERGILVNKQTGQAMPATGADGQPIGAKDKGLNDSQAKALLFGSRMRESDAILSNLADPPVGKDGVKPSSVEQPGLMKRSAQATPLIGDGLATAMNWTQSSKQQQVEQAQRDFINAVLRRESGAAIAPSEFTSAAQQYFPQPNDDAPVKAQKARARKLAIQGLLAEVPENKRDSLQQPSPQGTAGTGLKPGTVLLFDANGNPVKN